MGTLSRFVSFCARQLSSLIKRLWSHIRIHTLLLATSEADYQRPEFWHLHSKLTVLACTCQNSNVITTHSHMHSPTEFLWVYFRLQLAFVSRSSPVLTDFFFGRRYSTPSRPFKVVNFSRGQVILEYLVQRFAPCINAFVFQFSVVRFFKTAQGQQFGDLGRVGGSGA